MENFLRTYALAFPIISAKSRKDSLLYAPLLASQNLFGDEPDFLTDGRLALSNLKDIEP
jgi:hypothetical protein